MAWLLALPTLVNGQNAFSPGGNDYLIAGALPGDQVWPSVAVNTNGGYLVWQDNSLGTSGTCVRAERLNLGFVQSGPLFRVNVQSAGNQEKPQVALLNNGGAVIVWQGGSNSTQKIYARFLAADGTFLTPGDVLVNTYTNDFQITPAVASLNDGTVVVVWSSYGQDGDLQGIYGQRFTAQGARLGGEFQVNQYVFHNQRTPAVAALANGNFVVTWVSEMQRTSSSVDIYARIFNAAGDPQGDEFPVNTTTSKVCANPQVAGSPAGGFAVVWSQNDNLVSTLGSSYGTQVSGPTQTAPSPNSWDVFGRLFTASGASAGSPLRLNSYTPGNQFAPKISVFGNDYLIVWVSVGEDTSREGVYGQFLTSSGGMQGVEFRVNTTTISRQIHPAVTSDGVSRFLVVWTSFGAGTGFDLWGRSYDLIRVQVATAAQGLTLSWNTQPASVYQPQVTSDYVNWTNVGSPRTALGFSDSLNVTPSQPESYYRVIRVQ